MKTRTRNTLTGASLLLLAVLGGLYLGSTEKQPQPRAISSPRPAPALAAVIAAERPAHPAEAELNRLGLTLVGGFGVRAGLEEKQPQGGGK